MPRQKATLADVARTAGVSLATVDRVINQRGSTNAETEQRVFAAARALNLDRALTNIPSRTLRFSIVLILSNAAYFQKLRHSVRLARSLFKDFNISITTHWFNLGELDRALDAIRAAGSDCHGLIYAGLDHPEVVATLDALPPSCPIVTFATDLPSSRRVAYFGPDNFATGRLAGDLLGRFAAGRRGSVLILIGTQRYTGHRQREMGLRSVMAERYANLLAEPSFETLEDPERANAHVAMSLRRRTDIVAIYNSSNGNRAISDTLLAMGRSEVIFINHELTERTRSHLMNGVVDVIIDHNTDNDLQNAIEHLLFHNRRIAPDVMLRRENLNVYFRETAGQSVPVV